MEVTRTRKRRRRKRKRRMTEKCAILPLALPHADVANARAGP